MKFVCRLICATLVSLWLLPVWRSSFHHVKNHREYVVGRRKNQTFDSLDLFDARFFLTIFDHFCENFCKIKQYIKQINFSFESTEKIHFVKVFCFNETFYIPHYWYLFHKANIRFRVLDSRSGRKNWILTLKTLQLQ